MQNLHAGKRGLTRGHGAEIWIITGEKLTRTRKVELANVNIAELQTTG